MLQCNEVERAPFRILKQLGFYSLGYQASKTVSVSVNEVEHPDLCSSCSQRHKALALLCPGGCAGSGWEPALLHPACSRRAWHAQHPALLLGCSPGGVLCPNPAWPCSHPRCLHPRAVQRAMLLPEGTLPRALWVKPKGPKPSAWIYFVLGIVWGFFTLPF